CIDNPIETDVTTANSLRLSIAHVCVEIDLKDELIKEIELDQAGKTDIQKVVYERVHPFCTLCNHVGHGAAECYTKGNKPRPALPPHRRVARHCPTATPEIPKEKGKAPAHSPDSLKGQKGKGKVTSEVSRPKEANLDRPKTKATGLFPHQSLQTAPTAIHSYFS
ncbi:Unknown protein, partial [Striga hermonthica]